MFLSCCTNKPNFTKIWIWIEMKIPLHLLRWLIFSLFSLSNIYGEWKTHMSKKYSSSNYSRLRQDSRIITPRRKMYILRSSKISFIVNMEIDYTISYNPNYWYYAHSLHTLLTQIKLTTISSVLMFASPNVFSSAVYLHQILFIKQLILQCSVIDTLTTTDAYYTQIQKELFLFLDEGGCQVESFNVAQIAVSIFIQ